MSPEDIAEKMGYDYDVVINELDPLTPPDPGPPHYYQSATIGGTVGAMPYTCTCSSMAMGTPM
jgi:hypothetical protein